MKSTRAFSGISRRVLLTTAAMLSILFGQILCMSEQVQAQTDSLPSWNDGVSKQAIVEFVARVTRQGGPDFVSPAERIAVFDNDGTLWPEHPMYVQLAFALDRVKAMAPLHPEWNYTEPFMSALRGKMKTLAESGEQGLMALVMETHAGMTIEEFGKIASDWLNTRPPCRI
jgi:hypothetical protein